ncbi:MAG: amidohydrolase family protein [Clostridia bacterium]|nr:amidohydrolase family protein [Clostridia bacterium]
MVTKLICDKIISEGKIFKGNIYTENGKITCVSEKDLPYDETIDLCGLYVSPGFIDLHTHGGMGFDFLSNDSDEIVKGCNFHLTHGTTSIAPTVSAAPFEKMYAAAKAISIAKDAPALLGTIIGSHLEGPYLSKNQCGAQCPDFITPPIPAEYVPLVEELGSSIARWSYAPENDADGSFCKYISQNGIVPSAGHTDAVYDDMTRAVENGCKTVTHLYSCTSTITRKGGFRSLGVIESAYLCDDLTCEIIADGKHLPPDLIKLIVKIKGTERIIPVTDSLSLAGTEAKHGFMGATEYIIEDGVCKLCDRSAFAGSIATADVLIRVLTHECEIPLETAVKMMTEQPATLMGLNKGVLKEGYDADIIAFDENINIKTVITKGNKVYNV